MEYYARTGNSQKGIPSQTYRKHVTDVMTFSSKNVEGMLRFCSWSEDDRNGFRQSVCSGAEYHDLGKLDRKNQVVLSKEPCRVPLPIQHDDAGAAYLLRKNSKRTLPMVLAYSHHVGLTNFAEEEVAGEYAFRIHRRKDEEKKSHVDKHLDKYIAIHRKILGETSSDVPEKMCHGLPLRLALSCLVDGDYHSAALHSREETEIPTVEPRWEERLAALDRYVESLKEDSENSRLRTEVYETCRNACFPNERMLTCTSPVGTGKTTAVMARLLQVAIRYHLRRLFVVLPYTSIIQQSVDVYRRTLVLPGENPESVVAEHHHLADFAQLESRQLAVLWNTPIIVTTAVQFFETLTSNRPAVLRKLHEVPGSAIFVDEAHAAMPLHLWPQEFAWMNRLSKDWGCHFVLGSGSLAKIWEQEEMFGKKVVCLPELLPEVLIKKLEDREKRRVRFQYIKMAMDLKGIVRQIAEGKGSRLVVVNTVSSAAAIARKLRKMGIVVRHLSTALSPTDRAKILKEVREMLNPESPQFTKDWVLVATSCVEAGVDFSFDMGYRECCSITSLIQLSGRVNRNCGMFTAAEVFTFRLLEGEGIVLHPAFKHSAEIVSQLFEEGLFDKMTERELVQEAMRREIARIKDDSSAILKAEKAKNYPEVAEKCSVINSDTQLVVVNPGILEKLEAGERVSSRELQRNSVQMWTSKIEKSGFPQVRGHEEIYKLREGCVYDPDFLGYMTEETIRVLQNPNIF
ncbi:MAG: helicase-related protein [Planctomycetia bacterium]|nr:helicase-related protein [Planctomycetia bacterium]